MIKPIIYWQSPDTKNKVIKELKNNKVLITTTDTIPGFLANSTDKGFHALNTIKQDRQHKPYIILISDTSKLDYFVNPEQLTQQVKNLVKQCWPGPLTIIFKAKKELPAFLKSESNTIAIRCPNYAPLLEILKNFTGLFSTSANISNTASPKTIKDINQEVISQVKYIIDDNDKKIPESHEIKPSTIINISANQIIIVRQGAYTTQDLEKILGENIKIEQK